MSCRGAWDVVSRFQAQRALSTSITVMIHYTGMTARQGFDGLKESERRAFVIIKIYIYIFGRSYLFGNRKGLAGLKNKREINQIYI